MLTLRLSADDVANTRLAISPLWEVIASIRALKSPDEHRIHQPWIERSRARLIAERIDMRLLSDLVPAHSRVLPAFLAPPPSVTAPDIDTELAGLAAATPESICPELERFPDTTERLRLLRDQPERYLPELVDLIRTYWKLALAPYWPRIKNIADGDITHRARRLAEGGAARLFADLSSRVTWHGDRLLIENSFTRTVDLAGRGLLLVPSIFTGERVYCILDQPWQPTVRYPPRGIAMLWRQPDREAPVGLSDVIGRSRATILAALETPLSTSDLVLRCGLTAGGVSQHLKALSAAGLLQRHRSGRFVLYSRSSIAEDLLAASA